MYRKFGNLHKNTATLWLLAPKSIEGVFSLVPTPVPVRYYTFIYIALLLMYQIAVRGPFQTTLLFVEANKNYLFSSVGSDSHAPVAGLLPV